MRKEERLAHIATWQQSGLSRPAYCREQGLKYATFMSWFKLLEKTTVEGQFVALPEGQGGLGGVEIIFPNGIRVHYEGVLNAQMIKLLQDA